MRLGILASALAMLVGIWLFIAPFVIGSQTVGDALTNSSRSFLWSGGIVTVLSAATLVVFALMAASDAVRAARAKQGANKAVSEVR